MINITRIPEGMSGRQLARRRHINTRLTIFQSEKAKRLLDNINQLVIKIKRALVTDKYDVYDNLMLTLERDIISYSGLPYTEGNLLNYMEDLKLADGKKKKDIILNQIAEYAIKEFDEIKKR